MVLQYNYSILKGGGCVVFRVENIYSPTASVLMNVLILMQCFYSTSCHTAEMIGKTGDHFPNKVN